MTFKICQSDGMMRCQFKFTVVLSACLFVTNCAGQRTLDQQARKTAIQVEPVTLVMRNGDGLHMTGYRSPSSSADALVVLGHGFLRHSAQMAGLAQALAEAGMTTVALDFRHTRLWDGGHVRNAFDMIAVADALGASRVVYAGFSAGALAALIAGRNDPRTVGVVALDLVDAQGMGAHMAADLKPPLIGLVGDPSSCNAQNNGLTVYAASRTATIKRISGAGHCAFESPTDWLCRLVCERSAPDQDAIRQDIIRTATAAAHSLLFRAPPD